jgi:hypothetical protein
MGMQEGGQGTEQNLLVKGHKFSEGRTWQEP